MSLPESAPVGRSGGLEMTVEERVLCQLVDEKKARIRVLEAERDKYREALEDIVCDVLATDGELAVRIAERALKEQS